MFLEDFNSKDLIVINDGSKIENFKTVSIDEFLEAGNSEDGLEILGDLYLYIPDFEQDLFIVVKEQLEEAIDGLKWFVFDEKEIPMWFKADEAIIVKSKYNTENKKSIIDIDKKNKNNSQSYKEDEDDDNDQNYKINEDNDEEDFNNELDKEDNDFDNNDEEENINQENKSLDNSDKLLGVKSIFEDSQKSSLDSENKEAKVFVFGSSKGGTGKTFTCLISAYRYAKVHPYEKIAVADFDIIDGQVGISIFQIEPTMMGYWNRYVSGDNSFSTMKSYSTKCPHFPSNIDFYLAPRDYYINDKKFWISMIENLVKNYDTVFFDTGIDYINYSPISFAYKIADRVVLTSTTSIKSVSSVLKQIQKLKGTLSSKNANGDEIFKESDNIGPKLRLAITRYDRNDPTNKIVLETFRQNIKINAIFKDYSSDISRAEYHREWDIFDNNKKFNEYLDKLVDLKE